MSERSPRMGARRALILSIVLALSMVMIASVAIAEEDPASIDSCTIISEPGTYELVSDIHNSTIDRDCLVVTSSDVVLDGQNHTVDGGDNWQRGVHVRGDENVTVRDMTVKNWGNDGIGFKATNGTLTGITTENNDVQVGPYDIDEGDALIVDNEFNGVLRVKRSTGVVISENDFRTEVRSLRLWSDTSDATVVHNHLDGSGSGIQVYGDDHTIAHNTIRGVDVGIHMPGSGTVHNNDIADTGMGVRVSNGDVSVLENHITGTDGPGIIGTPLTVEDNEIHGNGLGMRVGGHDVTLSGNRITDNELGGLRVTGGEDIHVAENVIEANDGYGIRVTEVTDMTIEDTIVAENRYGIRMAQSHGATISNVTASNATFDGIRLFRSHDATVRTTTVENSRFGVRAISSNRTTVIGVNAIGNDFAGIRITDESWTGAGNAAVDNSIEDVETSDNGVAGVRLEGASSTALTNVSASNNRFGIWLTASEETRIESSSATNNNYAFLASDGSERIDAELVIDDVELSFRGQGVTLGTVEAAPQDPDGYGNVSRFVETKFSEPDGEVTLNISYDAADVSSELDESTLRLWRYSDGDWTQTEDSGVETGENVVYGTIDANGIVAPLSEEDSDATTDSLQEVVP